MVLAGPGSGKTTVITQRVWNLIHMYCADPASILVITFTKAAAREMKERFCRMAGEHLPVTFGTFHAVFFMILKYAYGYRGSDIVGEEERFAFMRREIARRHLETEDENDLISSVLAEIGTVKNSDLDLSHYYASSCGQDEFRSLFDSYQRFLNRNHRIDFEDMLLYCRELLEQRPDILAGWQRRFPYILIDEFQDINQVQYEVIRLLAGRTQNLFLVGDDDQSVYRFRGAKPEIMLHVKEDFPTLETVTLGINYRCPPEIVEPAGRLIAHNTVRFPKTFSAAGGRSGAVRCLTFEGQREESQYLAQVIRKQHARGVPYRDMAVLCRTNRQPRRLMEFLMRFNIPFSAKDRVPDLYDHWVVKDVLCYIRIARGSRDRADFLRIMNRPKRYLSRDSLPAEQVDLEAWERYYKDMDWMRQRVRKLASDLSMIKHLSPFAAINYIRKAVDYEGYLRETARERKIGYAELEEILDELQAGAKSFDTFEDWKSHIEAVRAEMRRQRTASGQREDAVVISTLHAAKGLEYEQVYIPDVNEGILPYRKSVLNADIEEERRLLYVGMTRAKSLLTLCTCRMINNHEALPSRFLEELKTE